MTLLSSIHPFPARMAPDVVRQVLQSLDSDVRVLDPMCGSGTVLRLASEAGLVCAGCDIDPLAVVMARAWTTAVDSKALTSEAELLVAEARDLSDQRIEAPPDAQTEDFIAYWFAPEQRVALKRIATVLRRRSGPVANALATSLSRIIVSKEMMASLARDTSHSRPHRVANGNDFDVYGGFLRSVRQVGARLQPGVLKGRTRVFRDDARCLAGIKDDSYDIVLTSPPYLNAIDYIRGHRLSLVWLGFTVGDLRQTRSSSIGAERTMRETEAAIDVTPFVRQRGDSPIPSRQLGWVRRYATDMDAVVRRVKRAVRPGGRVVLVVGNSFLRGSDVDNAGLLQCLCERVGLHLESHRERSIPARRRYLPPPGTGLGALDSRMRTEAVLSFSVP